jgi:hypothetical protein
MTNGNDVLKYGSTSVNGVVEEKPISQNGVDENDIGRRINEIKVNCIIGQQVKIFVSEMGALGIFFSLLELRYSFSPCIY